jgi:hypothetical protein
MCGWPKFELISKLIFLFERGNLIVIFPITKISKNSISLTLEVLKNFKSSSLNPTH